MLPGNAPLDAPRSCAQQRFDLPTGRSRVPALVVWDDQPRSHRFAPGRERRVGLRRRSSRRPGDGSKSGEPDRSAVERPSGGVCTPNAPRARGRLPEVHEPALSRIEPLPSPARPQSGQLVPWSDEAFEEAKTLGRPVFLSIGYSTCHWCHVMEEESFEDEEIARYLNENFIAIKVDREERPDVDAIYMHAVQTLTGSGGWPMSTWLTPDRKPFYGGTYFPPGSFSSLLRKLVEMYRSDPDRVVDTARRLAEEIGRNLDSSDRGGALPPPSVLNDAAARYSASFDPVYGGTGRAPKFPSTLPVRFLLRHYARTGSDRSLKMATLTLDMMAAGGIHDHVAGGFHRYSTDARWLVPHFEKMLYDNALLAMDYLAGYQVTGREAWADVTRSILRYVEREMTSPDGAFYSATDADSTGPSGRREEGWFFTWTPSEIASVLGEERGRVFDAYYGVTAAGNIEGRSILSAASPLADFARSANLPADQVATELASSRELLYAARAKRPHPARDEKILTAWNGLMISAYAKAALVLGNPEYETTAARAADFVLSRLRSAGRLLRTTARGSATLDAYLDDYAFLIAGLLDLFEVSGDPRWIREAIALDQALERHYEDASSGGFFQPFQGASPGRSIRSISHSV